MKILIVNNTSIPVQAYGGTERIVWWLGKALTELGHEVTFLVKKGSTCSFAKVLWLDDKLPLAAQIPDDCDLVHLHFETAEVLPKPTITTIHGNCAEAKIFHPNTVFISGNHAKRHGGKVFVYNGIDFEDYGEPDLNNPRLYLHFLGKAAWRVKNVNGAIELAARAGERLHVLGGTRVNFRMGLRVTLSPHVRFHGMVGGSGKNVLLSRSKGLLFPVLWDEPFGLAIIESLYFGCPVFGTPYGALPELLGRQEKLDRPMNGQIEAVYSEWGFLSLHKSEIVDAIKHAGSFDRQSCHDYVRAHFSAHRMANDYIALYEQVLNGRDLHSTPLQCEATDTKKLFSLKE